MENCLGINTYWYFSAQIPRSKSRYLPECFSPQNPFFHHASLNLQRPKRRAQHSSDSGKHTCWARGKPRSSCYPFWKAPTCDCFRVVGCYLVRHLADMSHEDDLHTQLHVRPFWSSSLSFSRARGRFSAPMPRRERGGSSGPAGRARFCPAAPQNKPLHGSVGNETGSLLKSRFESQQQICKSLQELRERTID